MDQEENELIRRANAVIESCGGIVPYAEVFYIQSLLYSSARTLESFEEYEELLRADVEAAYLVSVVQEAIGHAAALSRYFWPSGLGRAPQEIKELRKKRAEKLRQKYNLSEESPLRKRSLRDTWEHFDEKLDVYLLENDAGHFFPSPIVASHELADDPTSKIFKLLDTEAQCLVLLGKKFFFGPIKDEVQKVFNRSKPTNERNGRL